MERRIFSLPIGSRVKVIIVLAFQTRYMLSLFSRGVSRSMTAVFLHREQEFKGRA